MKLLVDSTRWVLDGMKAALDLHIHTLLSPCANEDMTPNNIVNMALLKGLDVISITDHNACDNVEAVIRAASDRLLVLPGMELHTREEVHLLCYFPSIQMLMNFDELVRKRIFSGHKITKMHGKQQIINEFDLVVGKREELLITSVDVSLEAAVHEVRIRGGVPVPAHIDRTAYGIISQLGFIPKGLNFTSYELSNRLWGILNGTDGNVPDFFGASYINRLKGLFFSSSDAHSLEEILEREMFLDVDELSISALLRKLNT